MQVNSINSVNFKGYDSLYSEDELKEASETIKTAKRLQEMLPDKYETSVDKEGNEVKKKSVIGTIASIGGSLVISYLILKKYLTKGSNALDSLLAKDKVQDIATDVKKVTSVMADDISGKISEQIKKSPKLAGTLNTIKDKAVVKGAANLTKTAAKAFVDPNNKENVIRALSGIGAIAGTAYVSSTDANGDGVADIAQKGINAYKGAVDKLGIVGEAIRVLS